jgi:hypothetical protein
MVFISKINAMFTWALKGALSAKIVNFCYPKKLSDMIDALIRIVPYVDGSRVRVLCRM